MFVACHLFAGLILGLVIDDRLGDQRIIGFSALGSILPDLIDKPVGHILLAGSLNHGRIVAHGLFFLIFLVIVGVIFMRQRGSFAILAVAAGVASHHVLDAMWTTPIAWYFPLLGPYESGEFTSYFSNAILAEMSSLSEWIFLFASLGIVLAAGYIFGRDLSQFGRTLIRVTIPLLAALSFVSLYAWAVNIQESILMAGAGPESYLMIAAVSLIGVIVIVSHRGFLGAK